MLSFFNLPYTGFCKMSEVLTVPRILIENRQLPPDATLMSPIEFSPQSASSANFGHSEAASAKDTDIKLVAPTISAKAATLDNRIVDFLVFMQMQSRVISLRLRHRALLTCEAHKISPTRSGAAMWLFDLT